MPSTTLLLFLGASLLLALTPGPTMLLTLSNSAMGGMRIAAYGMLGANLGAGLLITATALGLGGLLAASETWFNALRWLGVVYLCWMAWQLWRTAPQPLRTQAIPSSDPENLALTLPSSRTMPSRTAPTLTARSAFLRSFNVAISNPKTLLFFGAFLPQFVDPSTPQGPQYLLLGLLFLGLDTLVMLAYAGAGLQFVRFLTQRGLKWLNRSCAVGLWLLAATLALYRRH
ncbi:lysine transporter LysE [Hylemonella gracilis str. Niagara R]|uniref:Lysine transporter LysE n=1 Tax=Hylemonella gracilis str. Niagara R TaxID=1458275 RepID=A0A016XIG8_9BURK|nr:LysE family translocator [Hylemonella gracilis]EYC51616.1 lysine transporter LysE [Hylemonella gracilis str. Niagara R]